MARKLSEYKIAGDLGKALSRRLVCGFIRELQRMPDCLLSGDDSGLRNTWDEICVQQQLEHSFSWRAYVETMDAVIEYRVSQLQPYELDALWLLTLAADDWSCELEDERATYPVSEYEVTSYLQDELLTQASNWSNARISKYLERRYDWD